MKTLHFLMLAIITSCSFPKDSKDSLAKAMQEGLKVGIVNNPPFTKYSNGEAQGIEAEIIKEFAAQENLDVQYIPGTESTLVKQLEEYKLHIIIGGFEKNTVWKNKAGLTTRYNDKNVLLIAKGENELLYKLELILLKHKQNGS